METILSFFAIYTAQLSCTCLYKCSHMHLVYPKLVYSKTLFIGHSAVNHHHYSVYNLSLFIQHRVYPTHFTRNKCGQMNEGPLYLHIHIMTHKHACMYNVVYTVELNRRLGRIGYHSISALNMLW
jgi:hypothetical protein